MAKGLAVTERNDKTSSWNPIRRTLVPVERDWGHPEYRVGWTYCILNPPAVPWRHWAAHWGGSDAPDLQGSNLLNTLRTLRLAPQILVICTSIFSDQIENYKNCNSRSPSHCNLVTIWISSLPWLCKKCVRQALPGYALYQRMHILGMVEFPYFQSPGFARWFPGISSPYSWLTFRLLLAWLLLFSNSRKREFVRCNRDGEKAR